MVGAVQKTGLAVLLLLMLMAACGDAAGTAPATSITVSAGATFCSVFTGEYQSALDDAVPVTDDGFQEAADRITAWAVVLLNLAPAEIASQAEDNHKYHEAQARKQSAADFIPGSNEMHDWARDNC